MSDRFCNFNMSWSHDIRLCGKKMPCPDHCSDMLSDDLIEELRRTAQQVITADGTFFIIKRESLAKVIEAAIQAERRQTIE